MERLTVEKSVKVRGHFIGRYEKPDFLKDLEFCVTTVIAVDIEIIIDARMKRKPNGHLAWS
jgi:hypothetical protein